MSTGQSGFQSTKDYHNKDGSFMIKIPMCPDDILNIGFEKGYNF